LWAKCKREKGRWGEGWAISNLGRTGTPFPPSIIADGPREKKEVSETPGVMKNSAPLRGAKPQDGRKGGGGGPNSRDGGKEK